LVDLETKRKLSYSLFLKYLRYQNPYSDLAKNEIQIEVVMNEDGYEFSLSDSGNGIPDDIDANSTKTLERNIVIQI